MRGTAPLIKAWDGLSGREHVDATGLLMILAMARRASLGHGGGLFAKMALRSSAYGCVIAAATLRVFAPPWRRFWDTVCLLVRFGRF